jgi:hypothetical protein
MHSLLKTKAIRLVPEGMCKRCAGTGNGEEAADLGESLSHGTEFPISNATHAVGAMSTQNGNHGSGLTLCLQFAESGQPRPRLILFCFRSLSLS